MTRWCRRGAVAALLLSACSGTGSGSGAASSAAGPVTTGAPTSLAAPTTSASLVTVAVPGTQAPVTVDPSMFTGVAEPTHPLDGLSPTELDAFRATMDADGRFDPTVTRYPYIGLAEPDKAAVLAWGPGQPLGRRLRAIALDASTGEAREVVVDPVGRSVESVTPIPDARPAYLTEEVAAAAQAALSDPRMIAGLGARGLSVAQVTCPAFSPGSLRNDNEVGRRLLRISCYASSDRVDGFWARPIEGLVATYDIDTHEVIEVLDAPGADRIPVPDGLVEPVARQPVGAAATTSPTTAAVDGSHVAWGGWSLRWRLDRRVGLVVSDVSFDAGSGPVGVLYEGSLSDLYVPYQSPDPGWAWRTLLDAGEFGMGATVSQMTPGVDCPANGLLLSAVMPDEFANGNVVDNAVCVFERPADTPVTRHNGSALPASEMVVRSISVVGNYDYLTDVVLGVDGTLRFDVAAAGIVLQQATEASTDAEADESHGELIHDHLIGVNHDHFLNFRLDLDVAGTANTFVDQHIAPDPADPSIWTTVDDALTTEGPVTDGPHGNQRWLFEAPDDGTGNRPAYLLDPMDSEITDVAGPNVRASWTSAPLWITPYDPAQRHAGGEQLPDGTDADGLAVWTAAGRSVSDTDLVAWYTLGFHHVVRSEDWPEMPVHRASFQLVPQNVFPTNPLLGMGLGYG